MKNSCLVCGSKKTQFLYIFKKYRFVQCQSCALIFLDPLPSVNQTINYYKQFDYDQGYISEKIIRKDAERSLIIIEKNSKKIGKILDIGCGRGYFLDEARKRGWSVYGVDISDKMVHFAKHNLKLVVKRTEIMNYLRVDLQKYDVVVMNQVIEHISDPVKILSLIRKHLNPDGLIYITTPNIKSLASIILKKEFDYLIPPEHLAYYSSTCLKKLLFYTNYSIEYTGYWSYPSDLAGIIKYLLGKRKNKIRAGFNNSNSSNSILKLKHYIFDLIFCKLFYRILNFNQKGTNIDIIGKLII